MAWVFPFCPFAAAAGPRRGEVPLAFDLRIGVCMAPNVSQLRATLIFSRIAWPNNRGVREFFTALLLLPFWPIRYNSSTITQYQAPLNATFCYVSPYFFLYSSSSPLSCRKVVLSRRVRFEGIISQTSFGVYQTFNVCTMPIVFAFSGHTRHRALASLNQSPRRTSGFIGLHMRS